jgi:hypothetical protein
VRTATLDEASRQNFIGRLEQERLGATGKSESRRIEFQKFFIEKRPTRSRIGRGPPRYVGVFTPREGHRAGLNAAHSAVAEIDWVLDELKPSCRIR